MNPMHIYNNFAEIEADIERFSPRQTKRPNAYSLDRIEKFMTYVGSPQNKPKVIHIAGTSGKTSTAYYAAALLKAAGKKVGLMISPHMQTINERVQINLEPLPETIFCRDFASFMDLVEKSQIELTYAELLYGFAFWEFALQNVEYAVVEVGLGGLLDATNVITRPDKVCVITNIGQDHTNVLGASLREIATHKAGIIQLHNAVFCRSQDQEIIDVIKVRAQQKQADLYVIDQTALPQTRDLPLFQRQNFTLAYEAVKFALERAGTKLSPTNVAEALSTYISGRMEVLDLPDGRKLVLDGAHNQQKLELLVASLRDKFGDQPIAALVAFVGSRGRRAEDLLSPLQPVVNQLFITSVTGGHKSRGATEMAQACRNVDIRSCRFISDQQRAIKSLLKCPEQVLLITGSIYLLGQLKPQLALELEGQKQK